MKFLRYIQYFFYVGINWGWRIAFVIILQEIKGEKKYGIHSTGADELKKLKRSGIDISHATIYMPVSYAIIEKTLEQIKTGDKKHFLDIGCGRGRALCVAAHYGFNQITGIDFSETFCGEATKNVAAVKKEISSVSFSIIHQDAAAWGIPGDTDCIFLFNPFDKIIMKKVVNNIIKSLETSPRVLNIIYANPLYKDLFIQNDFKEIYYSKTLKQFEVSILSYRHLNQCL